MTNFVKRALFILVPATLTGLVLWVPAGASNLSLQDATLSCSDGTMIGVELDPTALIALSDAVAAINSYPAGDPPLACSLSQSSSSSGSTVMGRMLALLTPDEAAASGNPQHDYAVGGGQITAFGSANVFCFPAAESVALSAHVDNNTLTTGIGGTVNASCVGGGGHLVAKVDCLAVSGSVAFLTDVVTKSDGVFAVLPPGTELSLTVFDSGVPGGTGDVAGANITNAPCNFNAPLDTPIARGNINVHDAP